ncbi:conserved Plasmodium protein, unknown function [Plasmodium sp. gorilla clade G3]|nr:conserved Plasmodium protein, unknown function [Plasmodium sp. gorilla clade G3]
MQVITSDKIGLIQYIKCTGGNSIFEQNLPADLNRKINNMTWSGGYGGYEESEITICRENGLVESFQFYENIENPHVSDTASLSFLSCSNCIYTKMLNHHHNVIYEDILNEHKDKYANYLNFMPVYNNNEKVKNGIYEDYLLNSRLLVTVNSTGHVHVLNWEHDESSKYYLNDTLYKNKMENEDIQKKMQLYCEQYKKDVLNKIQYKKIDDKDNNNNNNNNNINEIIITNNAYEHVNLQKICKDYHYNNMIAKENILQSYILSNPINAACVNELLTNRLAIGGYKNCLKVFDLFTGTYLWKSKGLGVSLLHLNCETLIKSLNFLNDINVNILCASTYDHKIILYDMRCQPKPVYIYDHYKTQNVIENKYNYFDHNYSESDLVFTNICNKSHICSDDMDTNTLDMKDEKIKKENYDNNENMSDEENNDNERNNYHKDDNQRAHNNKESIYIKFNTNQIQLQNLEVFNKLNEQKSNDIERIKNKKRKLANNNHSLNTAEKDIVLYNKKEDTGKTYCIKKFSHNDSQIIYVSDNYGSVYSFEIITGNKLLHYIYRKKCAIEKITYDKKSDKYLLKIKDKLYEFYKDFQNNNKTHMRNDLPTMWAKNDFDQFHINLIKKIKIHNGGISFLFLHKRGNYLCSASYERFLIILNTETRKVIKRIHVGHVLTSCLFHSKTLQESANPKGDNECISWADSSEEEEEEDDDEDDDEEEEDDEEEDEDDEEEDEDDEEEEEDDEEEEEDDEEEDEEDDEEENEDKEKEEEEDDEEEDDEGEEDGEDEDEEDDDEGEDDEDD